ncbi:TRAP transporter substrate-binding protein DctP [Denitrobaculum tricleocarpae]|uniref:C4-dicarboxylate ABC transporter substrate-binding protein n=1 Tax=Denitrobaculum tricleocarpae TaxID=2591009 RepID=A0A545TXZ4_9PROT|nr:TRAP transporter substrate-binding protein DctP [Denitrobaculum tricleocarpae]TQV82092.1 C4-dicarboxylate ABC transporter substrate-binding protein [Denitrobaculum tricleocarpae]
MRDLRKVARKALSLAAAAGLATTVVSGAALAVDRVSAVHAFPEFLVYTKTFLAMVDDINARGEGIVEIQVRGGPEAIGMFQQPQAVRDGVVDMVHTPGSFYGASVPEIDAMVAARVTPMEARANGGAALMDQVHQSRFNVKHLGWIDGGVQFHIYSTQEFKFGDDGVIDLTGVKLRDNPIYHAFFEALNATTASMKATEVYSALEKGVVDAAAWTSIGILDLKWDKFLKYRIDPKFYNTDIGVIFNKDSWESLSPESQKLIQDVVAEWEQKSYDARQQDIAKDAEELQKRGMQFVSMTPEASEIYVTKANDAAWGRMKGRLEEMGGMENYDKLRKLYYKE